MKRIVLAMGVAMALSASVPQTASAEPKRPDWIANTGACGVAFYIWSHADQFSHDLLGQAFDYLETYCIDHPQP